MIFEFFQFLEFVFFGGIIFTFLNTWFKKVAKNIKGYSNFF